MSCPASWSVKRGEQLSINAPWKKILWATSSPKNHPTSSLPLHSLVLILSFRQGWLSWSGTSLLFESGRLKLKLSPQASTLQNLSCECSQVFRSSLTKGLSGRDDGVFCYVEISSIGKMRLMVGGKGGKGRNLGRCSYNGFPLSLLSLHQLYLISASHPLSQIYFLYPLRFAYCLELGSLLAFGCWFYAV